MNREQMEAWMLIEGWVPLSGPCSDNSTWHIGWYKGDMYVYAYTDNYEGVHTYEYLTPEWVQETNDRTVGKDQPKLAEHQILALIDYIQEKGL